MMQDDSTDLAARTLDAVVVAAASVSDDSCRMQS